MKAILILLIPAWALVSITGFIFPGSKKNHKFISVTSAHYPHAEQSINEGNYTIKAVGTSKYLDVDDGGNGEIVRINNIGPEKKDNVWIVKMVSGPLGGYTIKSKKFPNKYLDADFFNTGNNGCKIQLWERTGPSGNPYPPNGSAISLNQEWYIEKVSGR
ncbi:MAG: RICIN domain-containing protein, partial [Bacteroidota bacterium]